MKKRFSPCRAVVFLAACAGLVWFLIPVSWGVLNIGNGCGLAVCLLLMALSFFWGKLRQAGERSHAVKHILCVMVVLLCAGAAWSAAMTVCMISVSRTAPPEDATVIVLGSMVQGNRPSADLRVRIETASAYLKKHPNVKCIASGGQGRHENVTEASAIQKELTADGIAPSRILMEATSVTTKENFANSMKLAAANGLGRKFAVVTDDYHEFRACSIATKAGVQAYGVPAKTPWYIFSSCWAREVLALTKYLLLPG